MGSSFNFTAETFPDSPFLRTEVRYPKASSPTELYRPADSSPCSIVSVTMFVSLTMVVVLQLLDLEQDCAVVQKQSTKLAKGISAYLCDPHIHPAVSPEKGRICDDY